MADRGTPPADAALVLYQIGRFGDARDRAGEAIFHEPDVARHHRVMSLIHHALGDYEDARRAAEVAVALEADAAGLHCLARAHRALDHHDEAVAIFERALELAPQAAELHSGLALSLVRAAGASDQERAQRLEAATASCDAAAAIDPSDPLPHFVLALVERIRRDLPRAASHGQRALTLDPAWPEGHLLMAEIRSAQGMTRLASQHFASAASDVDDQRPLQGLRVVNRLRQGWLARRRGRVSHRLVPEAQRILEADRAMRGLGGRP